MRKKKTLIIILIVVSIILVLGIAGVMVYFLTNNNNKTQDNNILAEGNVVEDIVDDSELFDAPPTTDEEIESDEENIDDSDIGIEDENTTEEENLQTEDDMSKLIFNANFVSYKRTITGDEFNELIQKIKDSNEANPDHRVALTSNNLQDLNGIMPTNKYSVTFSYDEQGYVNNITVDQIEITEIVENLSTNNNVVNN